LLMFISMDFAIRARTLAHGEAGRAEFSPSGWQEVTR
jgi:hypothetical protein